MVKWLRERASPWNERAYIIATVNARFEILKWLRENCPYDRNICIAVISRINEYNRYLCEIDYEMKDTSDEGILHWLETNRYL
jgi:hypothetical protein